MIYFNHFHFIFRTFVLLYSKSYLLDGDTQISADADMNDYTEIGNYYCPSSFIATSLKNAPFTRGFTLKVQSGTSGTSYLQQIYKIFNTGQIAFRVKENDEWSDYRYFSDDATISKYQTMDVSSDIIQTAENQTSCQTRFYWLNGASYSGELPADNYKYGSAIVLKRASNSIVIVIFSIGKPIYNSYSNGSWSGWRDFTYTLV